MLTRMAVMLSRLSSVICCPIPVSVTAGSNHCVPAPSVKLTLVTSNAQLFVPGNGTRQPGATSIVITPVNRSPGGSKPTLYAIACAGAASAQDADATIEQKDR